MSVKFAGFRNLEELKAFFPVDKAVCELPPNLDIAPAREILAIFQEAGENRLDRFHWGLVPSWANDVSMGNRLINARAETIAVKPAFRGAFKNRRCLIPAAGFYEWRNHKGKKHPLFITLPDRKPFAFAGLWETWQNKREGDARYKSCAIITTRAARSFSSIHHRMPVILKPGVYEKWLDPQNQDTAELLGLLQNEIISEFESHPPPKQPGASRHIDPVRIETAGNARQATFGWPTHEEPSPKR